MSGTTPGPDFTPPPGDGYPQAGQAYAYPPPVPPPPRREARDNTVRNLLIALLVAIFTIVPATGMWVVASLKDKSNDETTASSAAPKGKATAARPAPEPAADPNQQPVVPPPAEAPSNADPNDRGQPGQAGPGGRICCCDGAPARARKACARRGGVCPCQGNR